MYVIHNVEIVVESSCKIRTGTGTWNKPFRPFTPTTPLRNPGHDGTSKYLGEYYTFVTMA